MPDRCDTSLPTTPLPVRSTVMRKLGSIYREARILRRLLRLLDDAERLGVHLTTGDHIPPPERKGGAH